MLQFHLDIYEWGLRKTERHCACRCPSGDSYIRAKSITARAEDQIVCLYYVPVFQSLFSFLSRSMRPRGGQRTMHLYGAVYYVERDRGC
jgi:hypothetical protein